MKKARKTTKEELKELQDKKDIEDTINFALLSEPLGPRDKKPSKKELEALKKAIKESSKK